MDFMVLITQFQNIAINMTKIQIGYGTYLGGGISIHYDDRIFIVEGNRAIIGHIIAEFVEEKTHYVNGFYGLDIKERIPNLSMLYPKIQKGWTPENENWYG